MSGRAELAIPIFEDLIRQVPDERRFVFGLARCHSILSKHAECAALMARCVASYPENPEARIILGLSLAHCGRTAEASDQLDQLERDFASQARLSASLGDLCLELGRFESALRHYQLAAEDNPDSPQAFHGMAQAAIGCKQFEVAVEHSLRATELVHLYPEAHHSLGVALTWMMDYAHAILAFQTALSMRPSLLDSHRYLASIYRHLKDTANAAKHRVTAERLISERGSGATSIDFLKREAPMGPQDWTREVAARADPSIEE